MLRIISFIGFMKDDDAAGIWLVPIDASNGDPVG